MEIEPTEILSNPAGVNLPSLGSRALTDVTDGDTPNIRMPIRMLSIDTPETTAGSEAGARRVDDRFEELANWLKQGMAPVTADFREHILPRLEHGAAGSLQFAQGQSASEAHKQAVARRLTRETGSKRNLFVRSPAVPFDNYGRLLAYVAPNYSAKERQALSRKERQTFNLDLIESGWASPFVIFPNIPGELDLPLYIEAAVTAASEERGQYQNELSLPAYEYRMCEKLYLVTRDLANGKSLSYPDQLRWRSRYCADMRTRRLFGPENYMDIPPPYRLWIWPQDVSTAIGQLNLIPKL